MLREIGADRIAQLLVFNKLDRVPELAAHTGRVERNEYGKITRVFLSAQTGQGLDALRAAIAEIARGTAVSQRDSEMRDVVYHDVAFSEYHGACRSVHE